MRILRLVQNLIVRMGRRRDQDETGGALGKIKRETQRQGTGPGMRDQDRGRNAEPVQNIAQANRQWREMAHIGVERFASRDC